MVQETAEFTQEAYETDDAFASFQAKADQVYFGPSRHVPGRGQGAVGAAQQFSFGTSDAKVSTEGAVLQGKAVIDGGATKTMGSLHAVECLSQKHMKTYGNTGVMKMDIQDRPVFGFGNSQRSRCMSTCTMQLPSEDHNMNLKIHVLEAGNAPVLLSVSSLRSMGAIIDYSRDEAVFTKIDPNVLVKLEQSAAGHQLLPLAEDFLRAGVPMPKAIHSLRQVGHSE